MRNQRVTAGQSLARLDDAGLRQQVEIAIAAVAVARALANEPSVILADEPTAALDSHRGRQVMQLFSEVAHTHGTAVIVVTHDQRSLDVFVTIYDMEDGVIRRKAAADAKPIASS